MGRDAELKILVIEVPSKDAGLDALDRIRHAASRGEITVEDAALVYKDELGKVQVHQEHDADAKKGAFRGAGVGFLVGLIGGPAVLAATAVGAGAGALIAKARDSGISNRTMTDVGKLIEGSEAGVFVLADEASAMAIAERVDELAASGGQLDQTVLPPEAAGFIRDAISLGVIEP